MNTNTTADRRSDSIIQNPVYGIEYDNDEQSNCYTTTDIVEWHERQVMTRRNIIKNKIEEYIQTFTVHGLTKVFVGKRLESAFWLGMLFCGLVFAIVVVYGLVVKYLSFGIYTEIRSQVIDENFFPAFTFCEKTMFINYYTSYCGIPYPYESVDSHQNEVCKSRTREWDAPLTVSNNRFWSNGFFNITKCKTSKHTYCASDAYFQTLPSFNYSCIRWNYAGNLSGINNHVDIEFEFNKPDWFGDRDEIITATPHDSNVHELDRTQRIHIEPHKIYEINLDKTEIRRLPHPFPSKCSNAKRFDHIFPGAYTRRSCIESHKYIEMYKVCGDTIDYVRPFIPPDIVKEYKQNKTINETIPCIFSYMRGNDIRITESCPFPCMEIELTFFPAFKRARREKPKYKLEVKYHHVAAYRIMEEKELYSWDQLACEIGGFISVVIGASIMSLIEIIVFLSLLVVKRFCSDGNIAFENNEKPTIF